MSLHDTALFTMVNDRMRWLTQRQRVIGQNIANANTPDYEARDLRPLNFRDSLRQADMSLTLAQTSSGHIPASTARDAYRTAANRAPYETTPDGNRVVLEEQLVKMNQVQQNYTLSLRIFQKYTQLYRTVAGGGQGGG